MDVVFGTLPTDTEYGTYNGFASGTINGVSFNNLICDDFSHTTYFPSGDLQYNVSTLSDFSQARFATEANALQNYENAAVLLYVLENLSAVDTYLPSKQQLTVGDVQYALWDIFTPGSGTTTNSANALSLITAAEPKLAIPGDLYSMLEIYTPAVNYTSNQEFLQEKDTSQVKPNNLGAAPEPGTLMIMSGILLAWVAIVVKRRSRKTGRE